MLSILSRPGAKAFYLVIFLNALVDLGHKITIQNVIFKVHDGAEQIVLTAVINALILSPYVLFFLPVGHVANKTAKPRIMRITAWVSCILVGVLFVFYRLGWFWPAFFTTFLMSVQSAFYSPAKLAYLKVMFGEKNLSASNGLAQSIVIIGILMGTLLFSLGFEALYTAVDTTTVLAKTTVLSKMTSLIYVLMSFVLIQLVAVYKIPILDEKDGQSETAGQIVKEQSLTFRAILGQRYFLIPMLGLALFWAVGQGMLAVFPAYAKAHASITNTAVIQGILTCSGLGIITGAWLVNRLTRKKVNLNIVPVGIALLTLGLLTLLLLDRDWAFAINYFLLGIASGLLIVPLNAYLQLRASHRDIGSVIATSNLFQNIAMLMMLGATIAIALLGLSAQKLLLLMAGLTGLVGLWLSKRILQLKESQI